MARGGADRGGNNANFQQRQDGSAPNNPMMNNSGGLSIGKQSSQQQNQQPNDFNNNMSARNSVTPFTTA